MDENPYKSPHTRTRTGSLLLDPKVRGLLALMCLFGWPIITALAALALAALSAMNPPRKPPLQFGLKLLFLLPLVTGLALWLPPLAWAVVFVIFIAAWVAFTAIVAHFLANLIEWTEQRKGK